MVEQTGVLTRQQTAERLGVTVRTLELWASQEKGPRPLRLSPRCIRYRVEDVEAFLQRSEQWQEAG